MFREPKSPAPTYRLGEETFCPGCDLKVLPTGQTAIVCEQTHNGYAHLKCLACKKRFQRALG